MMLESRQRSMARRKRCNSTERKAERMGRPKAMLWSLAALAGALATLANLRALEAARQRSADGHRELLRTQELVEHARARVGEITQAANDTEQRLRLAGPSLARLESEAIMSGSRAGAASALEPSAAEARLREVESTLQAPDDATLVVVTGVKFILERDFSIWDLTFSRANHQVVKTSKKKLARGEHKDWKVLKCLDLFDGRSHCIEPKNLLGLKRYQRVSRLYGLRNTLWNKDSFCRTMSMALDGFEAPKQQEFVFPCWMLPVDYNKLIRTAKGPQYVGRSFILKPTDRGEGNGIVVMDTWREMVDWKRKFPQNDEVVVQTYLPNPFLINERKWDMRTYVLVTSINPLRAYMYRDGLTRFAGSKYDKAAKGGGKATSFLTNTSVNKKMAAVDDLTWPFPKVYRWLVANGHDPDLLWARIENAVARMLLSAEPSFAKAFEALQPGFSCENCYQLLGVDVIVDDTQVPRVIEVNGEPSMQLTGEENSHYDHTKTSMARDLVALVFGHAPVAAALAADLMELELEGLAVGYEADGCQPTHDFCLSRKDIEYLSEMKREEQFQGGFRRLYPSRAGDDYTPFVEHLRQKFPKRHVAGSYRLHALATRLAKMAKDSPDNSIDDPAYQDG